MTLGYLGNLQKRPGCAHLEKDRRSDAGDVGMMRMMVGVRKLYRQIHANNDGISSNKMYDMLDINFETPHGYII
jgi:hypothetical protein